MRRVEGVEGRRTSFYISAISPWFVSFRDLGEVLVSNSIDHSNEDWVPLTEMSCCGDRTQLSSSYIYHLSV